MTTLTTPACAAAPQEPTIRKPDFFILGAPKAGTTSLYTYLAAHPRIFMPRTKEPAFFCSDIRCESRFSDMTEYLGLFAEANDRHLACGEASPLYLLSEIAVGEILQFNPAARLIVMLRNPIDLVYSYHSQVVRNLWEPVTDFARAWRLQPERGRGLHLPTSCPQAILLQYRRVAMLGEQLARLLTSVSRERVKILMFDDLAANPGRVYEDVLAFLGVPSDHRSDFAVENSNRSIRSRLLARLMKYPPGPLDVLFEQYRRHVGTGTWPGRMIKRLNSRKSSRPPLAPALRRELEDVFHDDVRRLERLTDRDLSHWIPTETPTYRRERPAGGTSRSIPVGAVAESSRKVARQRHHHGYHVIAGAATNSPNLHSPMNSIPTCIADPSGDEMQQVEYIDRLLAPYEPQRSVGRLVEEINRLYHSYEAADYDRRHPEIHHQLPTLWASMIDRAIALQPDVPWDVLDFGCGTGFASEQVLSRLPAERLRSLTCFDPSREMLQHCRNRLAHRLPGVQITDLLEDITATPRRFNVLVTNSVLHHLTDPLTTIRRLGPSLAHNAIWLCGHEPSSRFHQNEACVELHRRYEQTNRRRRYLAPKSYLRRVARALGLTVDPAARAALAAHRLGLFRRRPPRILVSRLVDFHVAHSPQEVAWGRGFDVRKLQDALRQDWSLAWHQSYNFLGPAWEGHAGPAWRARCDDLKRRFPEDGANFCSIWHRNAGPNASAPPVEPQPELGRPGTGFAP